MANSLILRHVTIPRKAYIVMHLLIIKQNITKQAN